MTSNNSKVKELGSKLNLNFGPRPPGQPSKPPVPSLNVPKVEENPSKEEEKSK
jgi:hypothetical protein